MVVRSKSLTVAAVLQLLLGLFQLRGAIPILEAGSQGMAPIPGLEGSGGPPFWAGIMFMILAVSSLFAAYGIWINQKWGKVLAVITCVISGLFALGDIVGLFYVGMIGAALAYSAFVLACVLVIVLVLRREPKAAMGTVSA